MLPSTSNPDEGLQTLLGHETACKNTSQKSGIRHIKPVTPSNFAGDCTKGWAFLNLCELYLVLAPHQFADNHVEIMWALSFMKSGHASCFVDHQMCDYQSAGSLTYTLWSKFVEDFITDFSPKNEIQTLRAELETLKYYQGSRTVDEYVDDFCELIKQVQYFEGSHIALKFCQGLNSKIQDHIACLTSGRPSDEALKQWYKAKILCDENCLANEAFCAFSQTAPASKIPSTSGSVF